MNVGVVRNYTPLARLYDAVLCVCVVVAALIAASIALASPPLHVYIYVFY